MTTIRFELCEVCGIELPADRVEVGTCSRGCRAVFRRMLHARATGDAEKLDRAIAAGAAIRAENAEELGAQTRARRERLFASRPDLAELAQRERPSC